MVLLELLPFDSYQVKQTPQDRVPIGAAQNASFPLVGTARRAVRASQRDAPTIEEFARFPSIFHVWNSTFGIPRLEFHVWNLSKLFSFAPSGRLALG